jgi:ribosomal protein L37AE/L43A
MSVCGNCKATLSCGCQKKKASNGVWVCRSCISRYEASIKNESVSQPKVQTQTVTPKLNEWGKDRYSNLNKFIKK